MGGRGGGGFPGNGLTKSGDTSRHIERGGLENDSECTSIHVCRGPEGGGDVPRVGSSESLIAMCILC